MEKIDYEGTWRELKRIIYDQHSGNDDNCNYSDLLDLEKKHTHKYIELKKRSDKEIVDYCLIKRAESCAELLQLKDKLDETIRKILL